MSSTEDPRMLAALAYAFHTSHWPPHLQRHMLGGPLPVEFIAGMLRAVDAADPLRASGTGP